MQSLISQLIQSVEEQIRSFVMFPGLQQKVTTFSQEVDYSVRPLRRTAALPINN